MYRPAVVWSAAMAIGLAAGCTTTPTPATTPPPSDSGLATVTTVEPFDEYPTAQLEGTLQSEVIDDTVYFIASTEGDPAKFGLVLPYGYRASTDGESVLDADGTAVAETGERYMFGGGEYRLEADVWQGGPAIDDLWLVGSINAE